MLPLLPPEPPPPEPLPHVTHSFEEFRADTLMLGLRYDLGDASSYGVALFRAWESREARDHLGAMFWHGPGLAVDLVTKSHDSVDAVVLSVPYHLDLLGDAGGAGFEARVGVAPGGPQLVGSAGLFVGLYFIDVGYSYQFPLGPFDRPDWMASHQFSVRLNLPLRRWNVHERQGATAKSRGNIRRR